MFVKIHGLQKLYINLYTKLVSNLVARAFYFVIIFSFLIANFEYFAGT